MKSCGSKIPRVWISTKFIQPCIWDAIIVTAYDVVQILRYETIQTSKESSSIAVRLRCVYVYNVQGVIIKLQNNI